MIKGIFTIPKELATAFRMGTVSIKKDRLVLHESWRRPWWRGGGIIKRRVFAKNVEFKSMTEKPDGSIEVLCKYEIQEKS